MNNRKWKIQEGNLPIVTNIQRFSLHDGPGIRTTIFLKGCSLQCPWCSNPENIQPRMEDFIKDGCKGIYGRYWTCEEIYDYVLKDRLFYASSNRKHYKISSKKELDDLPGGVTFSGGEPLLQSLQLMPLFQQLKQEKIHMSVETCLFVSKDKLELAIKYIDLFYVDIKILDQDKCSRILHGNLNLYLNNLDILFGAGCPVIFRIPVIGSYTDDVLNQTEILHLLENYRPLKVELIKEHNLGNSKYKTLGREVPKYTGVDEVTMTNYLKQIERYGLPAEICKI